MVFIQFTLSSLLLVGALAVGAQASAETDSEISAAELSNQEKAAKRLYSGGPDESDIQVREGVTDATQKVTRREIERDVYKKLFKEEMKSRVEEESAAPDEESEEE